MKVCGRYVAIWRKCQWNFLFSLPFCEQSLKNEAPFIAVIRPDCGQSQSPSNPEKATNGKMSAKCVLLPILVILCIAPNEREKCVAASLHELGLSSMCVGTNANENILGAVLLLYIDARTSPE